MTDNSNTSRNPEFNRRDLAEFEQHLRAHSLGDGPENRDDILYQCGFAAGVALLRKQQQSTASHWRTLSIAASLLATISLSMQLWSSLQYDQKQQDGRTVQHRTPENRVSIDRDDFAVRQSSDLNQFLTHRQMSSNSTSVQKRTAKLRHEEIDQVVTEQEDINAVVFPTTLDSHPQTLQPKDHSLILSGEA
jgi:hypothetical protein